MPAEGSSSLIKDETENGGRDHRTYQVPAVGKRVGIVQPPAGQRFKVMDDWVGRKAAELF